MQPNLYQRTCRWNPDQSPEGKRWVSAHRVDARSSDGRRMSGHGHTEYRSICLVALPALLLFFWVVHPCSGGEKLRKIIDVGSRKQLFIDEMFIESSSGVRLTMNPPSQTLEPVLVADQPWEDSIHAYSSVIKEGGKIRIWYSVSPKPPAELCVAYAESTDGIHFVKPKMNLVEINGSQANNIVLGGKIGGSAVWIDPKAPPNQRYKTQAKIYPSGKLHMHASPDGYHWTFFAALQVGHKDTQNIVFWDDAVNRYALYGRKKIYYEGSEKDHIANRMVKRLESDDLVSWDNEVVVMKADDVDLATYDTGTPRPPVDYYGAAVFKYPDVHGAYIMLAQAFWHWKQRPVEQRRDESGSKELPKHERLAPSALDVRLAVSRDGKKFKRAGGRKPFLGLGREGSFSSRFVWAMPNPIRMGDELWIYYMGTNRDHDGFIDPASSEHLSGISRAVMRLDGFVSADADYSGGEIVTPLIRFKGKTLELNLDTSGGGSVFVELLDENDRPIEGFTRADATPLCGNSVRMPVSWGQNQDVSKLAGRPIKMRLVMRDCKLYAFQFAK
ncbi:MAG: glycoside hydrolase family 32 protein [Planctomycetes bacterium]|nr:glycoside hydrolase family 32 protein [Planctomycetota bacterium]